MTYSPGRGTIVFGWLLTLLGIAYLASGAWSAFTVTPGGWPRIVVGLVAVVVGSSILRWAGRAAS
jgi:hypothetical protein